MLSFIAFPPKAAILSRLATIDHDGDGDGDAGGGAGERRRELYDLIAATLDSRTLDSAAFSFLLIELLHRHQELIDEDLATFLPKCILALTRDRELSQAARAAFGELAGG